MDTRLVNVGEFSKEDWTENEAIGHMVTLNGTNCTYEVQDGITEDYTHVVDYSRFWVLVYEKEEKAH